MASTYKRGKRPNFTFGISFYSLKRDHRFYHLVGPDKMTADALARRIKALEAARISGDSLGPELSKWLERLPVTLRQKLVEADLLDGHRAAAGVSRRQHLEDFAKSLEAKGITTKRIKIVTGRCCGIFKIAGIKTLAGITPSKAENALTAVAGHGGHKLTSCTKSAYLQAIKQFCRWAVQHGRMTTNPIEHLSVKLAGDVTKRRRPLTVEEVRLLVTNTIGGPDRHRIGGPERGLIYAFTAETGCRAGEVAVLIVGDFDQTDELVSVTIRGRTTKNRKERSLLLSVGLSALVRQHLASKVPEAKAFHTPRLDAFAKMLRKDLKAAGVAVIDDAGREVDFHGLRVTSASLMVANGIDVKLAQQRLGHRDPSLTLKVYAMTYREAEIDAMKRMPDLTVSPRAASVQATGTEDNRAATRGDEQAQRAAQRARNISVRSRSSSFMRGQDNSGKGNAHKPLETSSPSVEMRDGSSQCAKATSGIRTLDLRFTKAPLYH